MSNGMDPRIERMIEFASAYDAYDSQNTDTASASTQACPGSERAEATPHTLIEGIRRAIENVRHTNGLTQREIAASIGVSAPLLSLWLRGHREIPDEHLLNLAKVLGIDFRQVLV